MDEGRFEFERALTTVCSWCEAEGRHTVLRDVPDSPEVSHGICAEHWRRVRADVRARVAIDHAARPWPRQDYRRPRRPARMADGPAEVLRVDAGLDTGVLDRLYLIPGLEVVSVCAGHPQGVHIGYVVGRGSGLTPLALTRRLHSSGPAYFASRWNYWLEPPIDPPPGGSLKWFDATVRLLERTVADLLAQEAQLALFEAS
jgi:hypothetical protein